MGIGYGGKCKRTPDYHKKVYKLTQYNAICRTIYIVNLYIFGLKAIPCPP